MPYMRNGKRDYKREYDEYHDKPEQRENRSTRNKARRKYEKENGDQPSSVDIDHKRPLSKGGGNGSGNLRAKPRSANRSFARTKTGKVK